MRLVWRPPTCFEDLIPDGETCSMSLIIGHEFDEELVSRGNDWRGCDLPTVLPHKLTALVHAIPYFDIVVPERGKGETVFQKSGFHSEILFLLSSVEPSCTCDN